jgi:alpha/beta superfamily hydrolase
MISCYSVCMVTYHPPAEKKLFIEGPLGRLEARLSSPELPTHHPVGIVCHPHPLFQGTMDNKVVTTVVRAWQALEFSTIRFNFRGVGESAGIYDEGRGELHDLEAVLAWVLQTYPKQPVWLAGFSFGAYIAQRGAMQHPLIAGLISIAPALALLDFTTLSIPRCPWLIVQGDQDEVTTPSRVATWHKNVLSQNNAAFQPELAWVPEASHFFHGHLVTLKQLLQDFSEKHA